MFWGLLVVVVGGGLGWSARYAARVIKPTRHVLQLLPAIQQATRQHRFALAIQELSDARPAAVRLNAETQWVQDVRWLPGVGKNLVLWKRAVRTLASATQAASTIEKVETAAKKSSLSAMAAQLSPSAVFQVAHTVRMLGSLPNPLPGETAADAQAVRHLKRQLMPWQKVAKTVLTHENGIHALFNPRDTTRFLVLLQDSGELRSTGGFLADYAYLTWHNQHLSLHVEPGIAQLARRVKDKPPAPWVLRTYFSERKLSFINANFNPDVAQSAQTILRLYRSVPTHKPVDGVIFVDSWFADKMLKLAGPVRADGMTLTAQNLNTKMEYLAENRHVAASKRMLFLKTIASTVLRRFKDSAPLRSRLVPALLSELNQRHVMIYADNPTIERWLSSHHWAGKIPSFNHANSLLVINDNYGGLKDNYFLDTGVKIAMRQLASGRWEESVTTRWTMNGVRDGWMIGTYVGWIQCYVPEGTKLEKLAGYHVHGIRHANVPGLHQTAYGTGILIAPRHNAQEKPHIRTLQWVFLLPPLTHPRTLHLLIQPGLRGETVTYQSPEGVMRTFKQSNSIIHLR